MILYSTFSFLHPLSMTSTNLSCSSYTMFSMRISGADLTMSARLRRRDSLPAKVLPSSPASKRLTSLD